jgi:hypothetical protein
MTLLVAYVFLLTSKNKFIRVPNKAARCTRAVIVN